MAARLVSLDDYRSNLDLRSVVDHLKREGYEEAAVRRAIARIRLDCGRGVTPTELLVWTRRQLDSERRSTTIRRRW